ncbi:MAG: sulfotransferase [Silvibacterium sp.]
MVTWPNFFIVGAVKAGTTSLYAHLKEHPQVFLPKVKEPHYFAEFHPSREQAHVAEYISDRGEYLRLYRGSARFPAIGDASPSYLWDNKAPQRIHQVCPQARIIILLRDPVARAHSHYLMDVLGCIETLPFAEALQRDYACKEKGWWQSHLYVESGLYHDQVLRYLEAFGPANVLILLFDDLIKRPRELFMKVAEHLDIDTHPFDRMDLSAAHNAFRMPRSMTAYHFATSRFANQMRRYCIPASVNRRLCKSTLLFDKKKPPIDDACRKFLQEIYAPEIARLENLLGRSLPELRQSWL